MSIFCTHYLSFVYSIIYRLIFEWYVNITPVPKNVDSGRGLSYISNPTYLVRLVQLRLEIMSLKSQAYLISIKAEKFIPYILCIIVKIMMITLLIMILIFFGYIILYVLRVARQGLTTVTNKILFLSVCAHQWTIYRKISLSGYLSVVCTETIKQVLPCDSILPECPFLDDLIHIPNMLLKYSCAFSFKSLRDFMKDVLYYSC